LDLLEQDRCSEQMEFGRGLAGVAALIGPIENIDREFAELVQNQMARIPLGGSS
jgi:hypothetical protein